MAIPLNSTAPPAENYRDRLTGDNSTFAASLGGWTNSGGTLTRDTSNATFKYGSLTASAKLVTTATAQYLEVAVPGLFRAGQQYDALLLWGIEETPATFSFQAQFGLIGTDALSSSGTLSGTSYGGRIWPLRLSWVPTANRTGVKLRLTRSGGETGTTTWHVSHARAIEVSSGVGLGVHLRPGESDVLQAAGYSLQSGLVIGVASGALLAVGVNSAGAESRGSLAGVSAYGGATEATAYVWGVHTAGDRVTSGGVNLAAGTDFVGIQMGEKNSTTIQLFPDFGDYDIEILDGSTSGDANHWHAVTADGARSKLGAWFQHVLTVAGGLTVGTDKAAHFQVPSKVRIDEVRVHVGTAPTGQAVIVDVNDDGTTIFTTQANRPQVAASATNGTSGAADGGTAIAKDSVVTVDIDQVGSGTAGSDLTVFLRGRYAW